MSMHIVYMRFRSSVRAGRLHCLRASSQISCGRLCMELGFIVSHAPFIGRLCTEIDTINAHRIADALVVCARSSTFCLCASSLISRGRLCMELDFIVSHATFNWSSLYRAPQHQRTAPSSRFGRLRTQLDFFVCAQALRFHALVFV